MNDINMTIDIGVSAVLPIFYNNGLPLDGRWPLGQAGEFLETILSLSYEEILSYVDSADHVSPLQTEFLPQFAEFDTIDKVVAVFVESLEVAISYGDLGYYLTREERNLAAYRKYGENYGKAAALLGLACYEPGIIKPSVLTAAYYEIQPSSRKNELKCRLCMRIPLIQRLLYHGKSGSYNGYDDMRMLTQSTMVRRGQSPRNMLATLRNTGSPELIRRINNIRWES